MLRLFTTKLFFQFYFQFRVLKNTFSKLHPQKLHFKNFFKIAPSKHFQNCSLKKCIFEITLPKNAFSKLLPQKNAFSKLLPKKIHFQTILFKNCSPKKGIFKIAPSKIHFSKLLFQKRHFQNCFLKKH